LIPAKYYYGEDNDVSMKSISLDTTTLIEHRINGNARSRRKNKREQRRKQSWIPLRIKPHSMYTRIMNGKENESSLEKMTKRRMRTVRVRRSHGRA